MFNTTDLFHFLWNHTLWNNTNLTIAITVLTSYVALIRLLRYRRTANLEAPFTTGKRQLSSMTVTEAHAITTQLQELEFPYAFAKARRIALLKV